MRRSTLVELAAGYGLSVPGIDGYRNFASFERLYLTACDVIRSAADLERLLREVAQDAAADGAIWIEPAVTLSRLRAVGGSDEGALEILLDAARRISAQTGVGIGVMIDVNRSSTAAEAVATARLASRFAGRGVVALGLSGSEDGYPPDPFREAFAIARTAGLLSTPHAGEFAGATSVVGALDQLSADRILHGVRAVEDAVLIDRLAAAGICLDICVTSNIRLGVVASLDRHPLPQLLEAGVRVSLNGDDPLFFESNVLAEYELVRSAFNLSARQLAAIARSSLVASGAPADTRAAGLERIAVWVDDALGIA